MKKLSMLGILAGAALLTATPLSSADAQMYGYGSYSGYGYPAYGYGYGYPAYGYGSYSYGYPAYSYGSYGYGYPAYGYGYGGYLGYRVARRVAINRARWR
jgi:hypothetical protein